MTTPQDPHHYIHRPAVDADGNRVGKISQVYCDDRTSQPLWIVVQTGLLGTKATVAPIQGARVDDEVVVLGVSKDDVKSAPAIGKETQLDENEVGALRQHYSGFLASAGGTGAYEQSGRATQWSPSQDPLDQQ
jgi:hypothetical protein